MSEKITFNVNGTTRTVESEGNEKLIFILREKLGLTGTKRGCDLGDCGSCTVILDGEPVTACLVLAPQVEGRRVETIEGIGNGEELHPLQQAFIDESAAQCGYCIPGMIMAAKALLDRDPGPSREEIKTGLSGNLCRCTGYTKIIKAVEVAAGKSRKGSESC